MADPDGNRFLDFAAGIAVCATGHCHPDVVAAIRAQAGKLLHMCPTDFYTGPVVELAERLAAVAPVGENPRVFFTNSGAEAVESAIKLARLRTGRQKIVSFFGAFHGRTMGAATLTASKAVQRRGYGPMLPEVHHSYYAQCYRCPVNREPETCDVECLDDLELFHAVAPPDEIAAIIVEPIQGEGGYYVPKKEFLTRLAATEKNTASCSWPTKFKRGWGVLASCLPPSISGSSRTSLLGERTRFRDAARSRHRAGRSHGVEQRGHGSTYGGNAVSCAAAIATLDLLEKGLVENAAAVGAHLFSKLESLKGRHAQIIGDVRGLGLMLVIDLLDPKLVDAVLVGAFERGLLLLGCGDSAVRLTPPLVVTMEQADSAIGILDEVLTAL